MDVKNMQRLTIKEASVLLNDTSTYDLAVYFIEINSGSPNLLSIGDLEKIRRAFPQKAHINLQIPASGTIRPYNLVGAEDLVIRKTDYEEFLEKILLNNEKLKESERKSVYKMILGMAIKKYGYDPKAERNLATGISRGSIRADLDTIGLSMDDDTIRFYIKNAYEMLEGEILLTEKK